MFKCILILNHEILKNRIFVQIAIQDSRFSHWQENEFQNQVKSKWKIELIDEFSSE